MPDVRMPDGTVVKNVPEGTTKSELRRRSDLAQQEQTEVPQGFEPQQQAADTTQEGQESPGFFSRIISRAMGTDVEDPLELERMGTTIGGAMTGASMGARTPVLPGPAGIAVNPITGALAGGIIGAATGAGAPEGTLEAGEATGLLPEGAREKHGLSNEELKRVVSGEALLEAATGGTGALIRGGTRAGTRALSGMGKAETDLAERAAGQGIDLAPFQAGKRDVGRSAINVLGRFPIVGSPARKQGTRVSEQMNRIVQDAPERIGPLLSTAKLGGKIYDDARNLVKEVGGKFNKEYEELFEEASQKGVTVTPQATKQAAQETLETISRETPAAQAGKTVTPPRAEKLVQEFLNDEIAGVADAQSLRQMDNLVSKIDQEIASAPQEIRRHVARLLAPVRGAAKTDVTQNVSGEGAEEIGQRLADIDSRFSETMTTLFDTATAKRMGSVRRQGLRGVARPSDEATRTPVDKLYDIVRDVSSPQAVDELARLTSRDTMREIASRTVADAFEASTRQTAEGFTQIDADRMAKQFGLVGRGSKDEAMEELLKDTPLQMKDLRNIVDSAKAIGDAPIPNASTFVARRAVLGGASSAGRALNPARIVSGDKGGKTLGSILFFTGSRGLASMLSNPVTARRLSNVLSEEADLVKKRANFLRLTRAGVNGMQEAGEITKEQAQSLFQASQQTANDLFTPEEGSREAREPQSPKRARQGR